MSLVMRPHDITFHRVIGRFMFRENIKSVELGVLGYIIDL